MSSRQEILKTVRRHLPESAPLPETDGNWIQYDDPVEQFSSVLSMIGGRCLCVPDAAAAHAALSELPEYQQATQKVSLVPGIGDSTIDWSAVTDPHELASLDFAVVPAEFAVAENAAVWVSDENLTFRAIYFIGEHLAVVVPRAELVNNLVEGYRRLSFDKPRFGGWIAGPSKTADIEQSLVIGAHGPRTMTVILLG